MGDMNQTIVGHVLARASEHPQRPVVWTKNDGQFWNRSWGELADDVRRVAACLARRLTWGDRVATLGENRYEWLVCDLALQLAGAVHVPLHSTLAPAQVAFQLRHSGARLLFVSNVEQADKVAQIADLLPHDFPCYSWSPCPDAQGRNRLPLWTTLLPGLSPGDVERTERRAEEQLDAHTLVTILYTSGTEREPKGVVLNHGNLVSNVLAATEAMGPDPTHVRLCLLPFSHIYARSCDLYTSLLGGSQLVIASGRETALADCQEMRPTVFNAVPLFYERLRRALLAMGRAAEPGTLQALLGGRIRLLCCGGATLPDDIFDFFEQRGLPILQGYGLTECSPVITVSTPTRYRRGSVGPVIPHIEVRISDDGEILTRGPHVMVGYHDDRQATEQTIRDGWLHTGDLGWFDQDQFLYLTGRKKEIYVTSGGKNVAPATLEQLLTADPFIDQAVVFGEGRDYLTALIVPHIPAVEQFWRTRRVGDGTHPVAAELRVEASVSPWGAGDQPPLPEFEVWSHDPELLTFFDQRIQSCLSGVSAHEQVKRFHFLAHPFTIEAGELTPKLTPRRSVIAERYAPLLEALYNPT